MRKYRKLEEECFKPYYKWIIFNMGDYVSMISDVIVLNLIING